MRLFHAISGLLALRIASVFALNGYIVPPGSPGYQHGNSTQHIQFDSTSLYVDGKRIFLYGGEFHYWRLPVQALWSESFILSWLVDWTDLFYQAISLKN